MTEKPWARLRDIFRRSLSPEGRQRLAAILLLISFCVLCAIAVQQDHQIDHAMKNEVVSSDARRMASDLIFAKTTALAQTTVALIGATWALLIVSDSRVRLANTWSKLLFVVTNSFFLVSLWSYDSGYDVITKWMFDQGVFDIHSSFVGFFMLWQKRMFICGCLSLSAMILLWRRDS